ncbi:ATPase related to the helicase subunit of the Holliday junction resolvase [Handroanthus impetiginosus]|uniref:ATPase related to the helicase subunit of the Holliday junction resolvase n=1 Tax=Handroanthus impetiginosus TaxID=429701 RepID=A0A2G9HXF0_9LAMI|nr:ATPase related to the helicase subunit of the Holliday junction resolvase [Handroanthus impetiginosus]
MEMEAEIQQLVSMGFSADLASQALAAAAGDVLQATDWLLNHNDHSLKTAAQTQHSPPSNSSPPIIQPKINRFFHLHSKKDQNPPKIHQDYEEIEGDEQSHLLDHRKKRQKLAENEENTQKPSPEQAPKAPPPPPHAPLSERMRPRVLDEVVGQDHLLAKDSLLRSAISRGRLPSIVLWGPPGTGKTSIAKAIVSSCGSSVYKFVSLSAVTCGVKDVRDAVEAARKLKLKSNKRTVLFLDEVHRFNKAQQDSFLPVIEDGSIVFIGATTENPSFHLITPLLSRCRVLTLNPLKPDHLITLAKRAVSDVDRGLAASLKGIARFEVNDDAFEFLSLHCDGDARVALNALEIAATTAAARMKEPNVFGDSSLVVIVDDVKEALQCKHLAYDRAGEEHYNLISALHKSMRGSDADAAIYWLARMLEGGEEPLYIARRLVRFASEDVGLADPQALTQAVSCYQACHFIGMPECNVILAQCVAYLALAPKSVAVYRAFGAAQKVVKDSVGQNEPVPLHLRNAPTKLMKDLGYGKEYIYPPHNPNSSQKYLPPSLEGYKFLDWP